MESEFKSSQRVGITWSEDGDHDTCALSLAHTASPPRAPNLTSCASFAYAVDDG